jgi:hypothetical protein
VPSSPARPNGRARSGATAPSRSNPREIRPGSSSDASTCVASSRLVKLLVITSCDRRCVGEDEASHSGAAGVARGQPAGAVARDDQMLPPGRALGEHLVDDRRALRTVAGSRQREAQPPAGRPATHPSRCVSICPLGIARTVVLQRLLQRHRRALGDKQGSCPIR